MKKYGMKTLDQTIDEFYDYLYVDYEHRSMGSFDNAIYSAHKYLCNYRDSMKIQDNIKNPALTSKDLRMMFGEPIYFINRTNGRKEWVILYELHITECGWFVVTTDERILPLNEYDFYRYKRYDI